MERNSFVVPTSPDAMLSIIWLSSIQSGAALLPNDVRFSRNYARHLALFTVLFRAIHSHSSPLPGLSRLLLIVPAPDVWRECAPAPALALALARNTQSAQM